MNEIWQIKTLTVFKFNTLYYLILMVSSKTFCILTHLKETRTSYESKTYFSYRVLTCSLLSCSVNISYRNLVFLPRKTLDCCVYLRATFNVMEGQNCDHRSFFGGYGSCLMFRRSQNNPRLRSLLRHSIASLACLYDWNKATLTVEADNTLTWHRQ